jgi:hypothetical protein
MMIDSVAQRSRISQDYYLPASQSTPLFYWVLPLHYVPFRYNSSSRRVTLGKERQNFQRSQ